MKYEERRRLHGLPSAAEIEAATPEGRRNTWTAARPGRSIEAEGDFWVARQDGVEVARARRLLEKLMDKLEGK